MVCVITRTRNPMTVVKFCKFNLLCSLICLLVLLLFSVARASPLIIAIPQDIQSFDPFLVNEVAGESIAKSVFDNLLEYNFAGELVPGLATSYEFIDSTNLRLILREGVNFHNGEPFNAQAVKFSVEQFLNPDISYPNAGNLSAISTVEIIDDYTIVLKLKQPDASIPSKLTAQLYMVPPKYYKQVGSLGFSKAPIGTGPFIFVKHQRNLKIELKANKNYWPDSYKGKPQVEKVIFRVIPEASTRIAELITGKADIITNLPPNQIQRVEQAESQVVAKEGATLMMVWFATTAYVEILGDKRVRQAFNYAVDVETILAILQRGYGKRLATTLTPVSIGFNCSIKPYPYNPEKAKLLLKEADFPFAEKIELSAPPNIDKFIAEAIVSDLQKVGLNISLKVMDLNTFNDAWYRFAKPEPTEFFIASWGGLFDPASEAFFLHTDYGASYYSNAEVDSLLEAAQQETSLQKRSGLYSQIAKIVHEDPVGIYLWAPAELYGVSTKIKNWQAHPGGIVIIGKTSKP